MNSGSSGMNERQDPLSIGIPASAAMLGWGWVILLTVLSLTSFGAGAKSPRYLQVGGAVAVAAALALLYVLRARERKQLQVATRHARENEAQFEAMVNTSPVGIVLTDEQGHMLHANDAFLAMVGYSRADTASRHLSWAGLTLPEQIAQERAAIQELLQCGNTRILEEHCIHKNGGRVPVLVAGHVLPGEPKRIVKYVLDISDRKQMEQELKRSRDAAEQASRAKDRFIAQLSHELRTPLTPAMALISAIENAPELPETIRGDLRLARQDLELEARLIDDLLCLTQVTRGVLEVRPVTSDLHEILQHAIQVSSEVLRTRHAQLDLQLRATQHHVNADPIRLQQAFWNIIHNAARHMPGGGTLTIRTDNPTGKGIRVAFKDDGEGIPAEYLGKVFEAFEQAPSGQHSSTRGLGLGLAICRSIVEAHHGTVSAHSDGVGKGTTFTIAMETVHAPTAAPTLRAPVDTSAKANYRILLVEDHRPTLQILSTLLRRMGHEVTTADSVATAIAAADRDEVDLLVSDIGLPDGYGHQVMRHLSDRPGVKGIAISGFGMEADLKASREAGFSQHLTKPIQVVALRESIEKVMAN